MEGVRGQTGFRETAVAHGVYPVGQTVFHQVAGFHHALFGFQGLGTRALVIGKLGDGPTELEEDLAVDLPVTHSLAAGDTAGRPFVRYESKNQKFKLQFQLFTQNLNF